MQGLDNDVLKHRAKHDAVAIENVRDGSRQRAARVVVVPSRRVVEMLEDLGLWGAYQAIHTAVAIRTAGLGASAMDLSRVRGGTGDVEYGADLLIQFDKWAAECRKKYLSPIMVFDMVIDGRSFKEIDRLRHFMSGTAQKNLIACLKLWG